MSQNFLVVAPPLVGAGEGRRGREQGAPPHDGCALPKNGIRGQTGFGKRRGKPHSGGRSAGGQGTQRRWPNQRKEGGRGKVR